jgi:hypothetical protein
MTEHPAAAAAPVTRLDGRYSEPGAEAAGWAGTERELAEAELYWLSTVRPDGRPHVTPLIGVWHGGGLHFCTGPGERKARNLRENRAVVLTTGVNRLSGGRDLVVEGTAVRVDDDARLRELAKAYIVKYGEEWTFGVRDGHFVGDGGEALVFRVEPGAVFGFAKGPYGQTKYTFPAG